MDKLQIPSRFNTIRLRVAWSSRKDYLTYDVMPIFIPKHLLIFTILITFILLQTNYSYHLMENKIIQIRDQCIPLYFSFNKLSFLILQLDFGTKDLISPQSSISFNTYVTHYVINTLGIVYVVY